MDNSILVKSLTKCSKQVFEEMTATEVIQVTAKRDQRFSDSFPVAQIINYEELEEPGKGQFILGISDISMALFVAAAVGQQMGITLNNEFDETAGDILGELLNTMVGRATTEWDKLGISVRFSPPTLVKNFVIEQAENLYTEDYIIILTMDVNHIAIRFSISKNIKQLEDGKKVLVVDDSKIIRSILAKTLKKIGFEVAEAADGKEAVDIHSSFKPDLTIMDLVMPNLGGLDAIVNIQAHTPDAKFIILTSTSRTDEVVTASTLGVKKYLVKPLKMDQFMDAVRSILETK
ncbi:MAG: response regulator [Deltaproteobacteria bacterium]|nr:response regulator [Deltaproteobacteria bacterium]